MAKQEGCEPFCLSKHTVDGVHTRQARDRWVLVKAAGVTEKLKASLTLKLPTSQKMLKKKRTKNIEFCSRETSKLAQENCQCNSAGHGPVILRSLTFLKNRHGK